jgi:hypothetical protein
MKADKRIPPLSCHIREETRPYLADTLIVLHLRKDVPVPDLSSNEGGVAGGDNGRGWILPAIEYPAPATDTSEGKVQGGRQAALVDAGPDSEEGSDAHKLMVLGYA